MTNLNGLCNPDAAQKIFNRNYFSDKKLGFEVIEGGTILPHKVNPGKFNWGKGGIVDASGEYVSNTFIVNTNSPAYAPPQPVRRENKTVIYLGMFYPVWGHVLTGNLYRIWFLNSEVFKREFKNCPIVFISWRGRRLKRYPNFPRLLELLGVDVDKLQLIDQPTQFDKIILPDESMYRDGYRKITAEYRETIDLIRDFALKNRTPTSSKKVYYFYGKNQTGEERLAEYFKSKGYDIISPEKLSFDEQLNVMINADSFASTLGSCSHNSIFLRDNAETIFIPRAVDTFTSYQPTLDAVHPLNANYIDSTLSVFNERHSAHCFIIGERLKKFFGDTFDGYDDEDFKAFLEYFKLAAKKNLKVNPAQVKGCGALYRDFIAQLQRREDLTSAYGLPPDWDKDLL